MVLGRVNNFKLGLTLDFNFKDYLVFTRIFKAETYHIELIW